MRRGEGGREVVGEREGGREKFNGRGGEFG